MYARWQTLKMLLVRWVCIPGAMDAGGEKKSAAISNAIFDATGARIRQAPFTPRVKVALTAQEPR